MSEFVLRHGKNAVWYGTFAHIDAAGIKHAVSSRLGGVSKGPYESLNLGLHVGDEVPAVLANRKLFGQALGLETKNIVTAEQVHSDEIGVITRENLGKGALQYSDALPGTDALVTNIPDIPLLLCYADCVPVLIADPMKRAIGVVHAGWKGTVKKICQKTILTMAEHYGSKPENCLIGIGPSIGPCCYAVDDYLINKVKENFQDWECLINHRDQQRYFDLWKAVQVQLEEIGVTSANIVNSQVCTSCNNQLFFSYRRENGITGRLGAIIQL